MNRYLRWETFALNTLVVDDKETGSELTFDGTLKMGDSGTGTGVLYIDANSAVLAGGGGANPGYAVVPLSLIHI